MVQLNDDFLNGIFYLLNNHQVFLNTNALEVNEYV